MKSFKWIYEHVQAHRSGENIEALLPVALTEQQLQALPDDRLFSDMCRRVFRAGLKHSVVDGKWPEFEKAFYGFDPEKN